MESSSAIEVKALSKVYKVKTSSSFWKPTYKLIEAVSDISFTHNAEKNLGVFGKNGAGKTTLIKMLTGILHPSAGSIRVLDSIPQKLVTDFKMNIGLFQGGRGQLIWDIPAIDSIELSRHIYGYSKEEFVRRLGIFSEALNITNEIHQPLRNMSLGQRTKMELLYSFIHLPRIVFLDEPTSGLDVISRDSLRKFINFCHEEFGICFIICSHNVKDILDCCDTCLVMHKGKILYQGDTAYLLEKHSHEKVVLHTDSHMTAQKIASDYNGRVAGNMVVLDFDGDASSPTICDIVGKHAIVDFKVEKKDNEDIIVEILSHE